MYLGKPDRLQGVKNLRPDDLNGTGSGYKFVGGEKIREFGPSVCIVTFV